jgi:hypothetical protein
MDGANLPELPPVADAISAGRLLVFAGSGLSVAPPACLPDWRGFNASLLAPIRASASTLAGLHSAARDAIDSLQIDNSRVLAFSEFLVGDFAGNDYLPVLQVLDGDKPNAYHRALATLSRAGGLGAIVTTNFDTLIEKAFAQSGQDIAVEGAANRSFTVVPLIKIHGSVTDTATLKDTVSQKLRGLPLPLRARIAALYRDHHVLVVGFSGADLAFGGDYLAFAAIDAHGPGITWMLRPAEGASREAIVPASHEQLPEAARAAVLRAGVRGAVVEADLLGLCIRLGIAVPMPPERAGAVASRDEAQAAADKRAREWTEAWFAKLGRSPAQCAMFCAAYLRSLGRQNAAAAICLGLEPHISALAEDDPMSAVNLALVLADHAKEQHDVRRVERLSQWSVEVTDALVAVGDARRAPWARLRALALSNLGLVAQLRGDTAGNDFTLGEAMRSAERAEDATLVAALRANQAQIAGKGGDFERQLALARQASALMLRSHTPHKAWEQLALEAFTLNRLAEYDQALATLQRAAALLRLDHDPVRGRMTLAIAEADILKHRGRIDEAWAMLQRWLGVLGEHPMLAAYLRFNLLEMFDFHGPLRPALQHEIDVLLAAMTAGHVPGDGSAPPLPTAQVLREQRAILEGDDGSREPRDLRWGGPPRDSVDACRRRVKALEYRADIVALPPCFEFLGRAAYESRDPQRLLDSAVALIAAAQRAEQAAARQEGLRRQAIAAQMLGDIWQSIDAIQSLLAAERPVDPVLQAALHRDLGTAFSRLGDRDGMRRAFDAMYALHLAGDDADAALAAGTSVVDAWMRAGDPDAAAAHIARLHPWLARSDAEMRRQWQDVETDVDRLRRELPLAPDGLPAPLFTTIEPADEASFHAERPWVTTVDELRNLALRCAIGGHAALAQSLLLEAQREFLRLGDALGVAQCLHDQAEAACIQRHWEVVREYGLWACDMRRRLGDAAGQVDSGAAWALGAYQLGMSEEATGAAQDALTIALQRTLAPTRWVLIGWCVLAAVYGRVGREDDRRLVRQDFLAGYPADPSEPLLQAARAWFESATA